MVKKKYMTMSVKKSRKILWMQPCQEKKIRDHYVKQIAVEMIKTKKNEKEERRERNCKKNPSKFVKKHPLKFLKNL